MRLDLANGTMQHRDFQFRCPKTSGLRSIRVPQGRQVVERLDYDSNQIGALELQLNKAGFAKVGDVKAITSPYALIYSIDAKKPIASDQINDARVRDQEVRQDIASAVTEQSGLAMFHVVESRAPENLRGTTLDVQEMEPVSDMPVKHGVNYEAKVSRSAGRKRDERRSAA